MFFISKILIKFVRQAKFDKFQHINYTVLNVWSIRGLSIWFMKALPNL